jgi:ABC-type taurine transport system ATPase subunit
MRITDALAQTKRLDEALVLGTKTVDLCRVAVEEVALVATETREENFAKRLAAEGAQRSVES